jgi:hypothetical protein
MKRPQRNTGALQAAIKENRSAEPVLNRTNRADTAGTSRRVEVQQYEEASHVTDVTFAHGNF